MTTPPRVYKHNQNFVPDAPFLSDAALIEVLDARPILCVDVLLVDRTNKQLILPKRTSRPAEGLWFIGGMIKRNTPPQVAAAKVVAREAGTDIDPARLSYVAASWFEWDYRKEAPQENGRVDFNLCYAFEPSADELASISASLAPEEYDTEHGLHAYGRAELAAAIQDQSPCKQVLLDYFDLIFS